MRQVSADLAAALAAGERVIFQEVEVDWDNDGYDGPLSIDSMSRRVASLTSSHSLSSTLPPQARVVPGVAVADLNIKMDSGNVVQKEIPAIYRSVSTATSGTATTTTEISFSRPPGVQKGDVLLLGLFNTFSVDGMGVPGRANAYWNPVVWRGDRNEDASLLVGGMLLTRRVGDLATEPTTYRFPVYAINKWVAICVRVGDANILGIHAYSSKGLDGFDVSSPVVTGTPLVTRLDNCELVSFFAATTAVTGVSWTPDVPDTERADLGTTVVGDNVSACVTTRSNVPAGRYETIATASTSVSVTVQFTVALAPRLEGDERQNAAWTFSELNPLNPYSGKIRTGRRVRWRMGCVTEAGLEYVPIFEGQTTNLSGDGRAKTTMISALDNREVFRSNARSMFLPARFAEYPFLSSNFSGTESGPNWPGLDVEYMMSFAFANAYVQRDANINAALTPAGLPPDHSGMGFFASYPPVRATIVWLPMHGSLEPINHGTTNIAYTQMNTGARRRVRFYPGALVSGTEPAPINGFIRGVWNGNAEVQIWSTATGQTRGRYVFMGRRTQTFSTFLMGMQGSLNPTVRFVRAEITNAGVFRLLIGRDGSITRTVTGPTVPSDNEWHYYGVHWDSTTGNVTFRIDETNTAASFATFANTALSFNFEEYAMLLEDGQQVAEFQSYGGYGLDDGPFNELITAATPWSNETFTPSAFIDKSINSLEVGFVPDPGQDVWEFLSELAQVEFAALYLDADGYPHFRTFYSDVDDEGQTIAKAFTATSSLMTLAYSSGIREISNSIQVGYAPLQYIIDGEIWNPSGAMRIPAGQTVVVSVALPGPVFTVSPVTITAVNTAPDGSGTNVTPILINAFIGAASDQMSVTITLISGHPFDVWLVDPSGVPSASAAASYVAPADTPVPETITDSDSVRIYDLQILSVPSSDLLQDQNVARNISTYLVGELAYPKPTITDMEIVGDPRLEFGDMGNVVDVDGLGVDGLYRLTGKKTAARDGFTQDVTLREAAIVAVWDVNDWDDGSVWGA